MKRSLLFIIILIFSSGLILLTPALQGQAPPGMVLIPGGEFEMGDHYGVGEDNELPLHDVYIDSFYLDVFEVTNQQYCDYLNDAYGQGLIEVSEGLVYKADDTEIYCRTTSYSSDCWITWNGSAFGVTAWREDHPMITVTWYGAAAYANWRSEQDGLAPCYKLDSWRCRCLDPIKGSIWMDEVLNKAHIEGKDDDLPSVRGYRLPTEAEWEYAARGGLHGPYCRYPWGDTLVSTIANYQRSGDPFEAGLNPETTPVGFYTGALHDWTDFNWPGGETSYQTTDGENGYGLYDMAGNVRE